MIEKAIKYQKEIVTGKSGKDEKDEKEEKDDHAIVYQFFLCGEICWYFQLANVYSTENTLTEFLDATKLLLDDGHKMLLKYLEKRQTEWKSVEAPVRPKLESQQMMEFFAVSTRFATLTAQEDPRADTIKVLFVVGVYVTCGRWPWTH